MKLIFREFFVRRGNVFGKKFYRMTLRQDWVTRQFLVNFGKVKTPTLQAKGQKVKEQVTDRVTAGTSENITNRVINNKHIVGRFKFYKLI